MQCAKPFWFTTLQQIDMDQTVEEEAALVCQENKHALPGLKSCAPAFNKFYSCSHFCFETKLANNFVFQLFHFCTLTYYVGLSHQLFVSWIFPKIHHLKKPVSSFQLCEGCSLGDPKDSKTLLKWLHPLEQIFVSLFGCVLDQDTYTSCTSRGCNCNKSLQNMYCFLLACSDV